MDRAIRILRHLKPEKEIETTNCNSSIESYNPKRTLTPVNFKIKLAGVGRYLPKNIRTNEFYEKKYNLRPGWIEKRLKIKYRHYATEQETACYMASQACIDAVKDAGLTLDDIDLIICASGGADSGIPDDAPRIQHLLGLSSKGVPAFSVRATCLGFVVGLHTAALYIKSGLYKNVLVVCSESPDLDWGVEPSQPQTAAILGHGAAAVVVVPTPSNEKSEMLTFSLETYGDQADKSGVKGCGNFKHPNNPNTTYEDNCFHMNGQDLIEILAAVGPGVMDMHVPGLTSGEGDVDILIPHQPSAHGLESLEMLLGENKHKLINIFEKTGNVISASIPLALYEAIKTGKLKRGNKVFLMGMAAGVSVAGSLLIY